MKITNGETRAKRLVRVRDKVCTECGMTQEQCRKIYGRGLHVHRLVKGSIYTVDGCKLLCKRCHCLVHGKAEPTPPKSYPPLMPPTSPRQFQLTPERIARLDKLAIMWGGKLQNARGTDVINALIDRAWETENNSGKIFKKPEG